MADKKISQISIGSTLYDIRDCDTYTKTEVDTMIAAGVKYLGTAASVASLTAKTTATYGDFARASAKFDITDITGSSVTAHIGDTLILESNAASAYASTANWRVLHEEPYDFLRITNDEIDTMMAE